MEKCITKAGSEKVISFAEKKSQAEESKWETIGGARIRRPNTELQKPHVVQGDNSSIYAGETTLSDAGHNATVVEKVIRFLWDGNTILHEWEDDANSSKKPHQKIDFQADYVVKLSEKQKQEAKEKTAKGEVVPESLITWIFQDDFIPRAKLTKDGCYSIFTDYLGTPVGAYDESGNLVWERELDINGKVMPAGKDNYGRTLQDIGEKTFIPFRFQGQYEDEEIGLYYNRFRYYDPETGQYTQQDPIGVAGGMNLYSYVKNSNCQFDILGWEDIVYRALRPEDILSIQEGLGIIPKNSSANALPIEHVLYGSEEFYGDQYISFTRDEGFARSWAAKKGTGVASIDLDTIHNTKIDLSTAEGRIAHLGDASKAAQGSDLYRANKWARGAKEVLVEGEIPANKVNYSTFPAYISK